MLAKSLRTDFQQFPDAPITSFKPWFVPWVSDAYEALGQSLRRCATGEQTATAGPGKLVTLPACLLLPRHRHRMLTHHHNGDYISTWWATLPCGPWQPGRAGMAPAVLSRALRLACGAAPTANICSFLPHQFWREGVGRARYRKETRHAEKCPDKVGLF